jgi:hypothetical protein
MTSTRAEQRWKVKVDRRRRRPLRACRHVIQVLCLRPWSRRAWADSGMEQVARPCSTLTWSLQFHLPGEG